MELVLTIVFNNEEALKMIDKKDIFNIQMSSKNIEIDLELKEKYICEYLYQKLHNAVVKVAFAINNKKPEIELLEKQKQEIIKEIKECNIPVLTEYILSEYKLDAYESVWDSCFSIYDLWCLKELDKTIKEMYEYDVIYNHRKNIKHKIFEKCYYDFMSMEENVMDLIDL